MNNKYYILIKITHEQIENTNELVNYSINHHPIQDIYKNDPGGKENQRVFRFVGTIGEITFADFYYLPRPQKSYGAIDGQDFGQDFNLIIDNRNCCIDVKTMRRNNGILRKNYVVNIPSYQLYRETSLTDCYFAISIHKNRNNELYASLLGYTPKEDILSNKVGILYKAGTTRVKDNGSTFIFARDTYEVELQDFYSPPIPDQKIDKNILKIKYLL